MISFVLTSVGAATQYIPFSSRYTTTTSTAHAPSRPDADLSINRKLSSSSSSSSTTAYAYSSDEGSSSSSSSTAYSSPAASPTTSSASFPQQHGPHVATHDAPSSSSNPSRPVTSHLTEEELRKYAVIHQILRASDLYAVLDIERKCDANALRRAYMRRCKACHPDKYPSYPLATVAFQKVSFAYDILSTPSSRRMYDLHGVTPDADPSASFSFDENGSEGINLNFTHPSHTARADETLSGVLLGVFLDFMEGDFQMLRTFLRAMNEVNPALNISDETIESLVSTFTRLREVLLTTKKYVRILHIELIQLHEIQHNLRALPYLDIFGRMRLTLRLARCTLALPCVVDAAMIRDAEEQEVKEREQELQERKREAASSLHGSSSSAPGSPGSRKRPRPSDIAGSSSMHDDAQDDGTHDAEHSRHHQRRRRPRVRTTSTSGPFDDAPFPSSTTSDSGSTGTGAGKRRKGLLHPRVNSMIQSACAVLEYGESVL